MLTWGHTHHFLISVANDLKPDSRFCAGNVNSGKGPCPLTENFAFINNICEFLGQIWKEKFPVIRGSVSCTWGLTMVWG